METIERCADGDLTARLDEDVADEQLQWVATAFNELIDGLEETLTTVGGFGDQVGAATEEVSVGVGDAREVSRETSSTIETITDGATRQHEYIADISEEMSHLSAATEEVAAKANDIAASTQEAAARGEEGRDAATNVIGQLDKIDDLTTETVDSPPTNGARIGPFSTMRTLVAEGVESVLDGVDVDRTLGRVHDEVERMLREYEAEQT